MTPDGRHMHDQATGSSRQARQRFFLGAQFSRKLARLYDYSYLGPVFYMNIHIAHDTKVFVTLRERKKSNEISIPCP